MVLDVLKRLPVQQKDAILIFLCGILTMIFAFTRYKILSIFLACVLIFRAVYKWKTSPTLETQVSTPMIK